MIQHWKWARFIAYFIALSVASASASAGNLQLSGDKRWVIIASHPTSEEAQDVARSYKAAFKNTSIIFSDNQYYTVTVGVVPYPAGKDILRRLVASNQIPSDSFLATGSKFQNVAVDPNGASGSGGWSLGDFIAAGLVIAGGLALYNAVSSSGTEDSSAKKSSGDERSPFVDGLMKKGGELAAEGIAKSLTTAAANSGAGGFRITNSCRHPIRVAIYFRNLQDAWNVMGWWSVGGGATLNLSDASNSILQTTSATWYYYAETTDDAKLVWQGDHIHKLADHDLPMRQAEDKSGDSEWTLTCN